jgi:hypothetical protein
MPEKPMMTEAQRDEPKTLCATADVSDRSWYQARTRTLILGGCSADPNPLPQIEDRPGVLAGRCPHSPKTTLKPPIALVAWQWFAAAPPVAPLASPRVSAAAAQVLTRRARRG